MTSEPTEPVAMSADDLVQVIVRLKQELAERDAEIHRVSVTDELTGALNRRGFLAAAEQRHRQVRHSNGTGHLLFIDVDGLKAVNDTHGSAAGDDLIRRATDAVSATVQDIDVVGRWGGDELVVYTTTCDIEQLGQQILAAAAANSASLSIGFASFTHTERRSIDELIIAADSAMYVQRRQRRISAASAGLPAQRKTPQPGRPGQLSR
jgi:diguanylate cyclase (GGDEF)-like protein